ncbi:MAG: HIT domain-containing protein [Candidatus Omnitrophica bacterium]|nr:HIT domain-containing protein [Candidatus Omnitrophota bacterium]
MPQDFLRRIWAPWRHAYVAKPPTPGCLFCRARRSRDDRAMLIVHRGREVFCMLNRYPYNAGHVMVAVGRHVGRLSSLSAREAAELLEVAGLMEQRLARLLRPDGFNVGINVGRAAGAGIPGHLHLHLVPRWVGDTNFMTVTGHVKVIVRSLDALYEGLTRPHASRPRKKVLGGSGFGVRGSGQRTLSDGDRIRGPQPRTPNPEQTKVFQQPARGARR